MRFIIMGLGAIGGTVAAALASAGQEVIGVARGAHLEAIRTDGLLLRTPDGPRRTRFECVALPREIELRDDDMVLLAMKAQDTEAALGQLAAAGMDKQPLFCLQNGIDNERMALRRFENVHGIAVLLGGAYSIPGEVAAYGTPMLGILDIGRAPDGKDDADEALAAALTDAGIAGFAIPDVMRNKYGKLLLNLANMHDAAFGRGTDTGGLRARLRAEGEAVFKAAGIAWREMANDPRRETLMRFGTVEGAERAGNSSIQSLLRGGTVETDYLNGEIVLLGRLHGVPTPANALLQKIGVRMMREGLAPGTVPLSEVPAALLE